MVETIVVLFNCSEMPLGSNFFCGSFVLTVISLLLQDGYYCSRQPFHIHARKKGDDDVSCTCPFLLDMQKFEQEYEIY